MLAIHLTIRRLIVPHTLTLIQANRVDVAEASYGNPGPYTRINDYSQTFPVDCGHAGEYQAPKGYMIQKDKSGNDQCCYTMLIEYCPPGPGEIPRLSQCLHRNYPS